MEGRSRTLPESCLPRGTLPIDLEKPGLKIFRANCDTTLDQQNIVDIPYLNDKIQR